MSDKYWMMLGQNDYDPEEDQETWWYKTATILIPCPECGGIVDLGIEYDWPHFLGGDYVRSSCHCIECRKEWREGEEPDEFTVGNGEYWNVLGLTIVDIVEVKNG